MAIKILLLESEICCDWGHSLAIHAKFMLEKKCTCSIYPVTKHSEEETFSIHKHERFTQNIPNLTTNKYQNIQLFEPEHSTLIFSNSIPHIPGTLISEILDVIE